MEKTNNVSCKKWGQFGGAIVQFFYNLVSHSQSLLSHHYQSWEDSIFYVNWVFSSSQERGVLWGFILQRNYHWQRAIKPHGKPQPFGQLAMAHHSDVVPYSPSASRQPFHMKSNNKWRTEVQEGNYDQLQRMYRKWVYSTANFPLSAAYQQFV